jgi:benzoyl-CoA reductase subunit D
VVERIRKRDPRKVVGIALAKALAAAGLKREDIDYLASTGEGEMVDDRDGHFYGMTTHARGALYLFPQARCVIDAGALHARTIKMDHRSKVLQYKMTGQCASGSGQFLENITRYLGVSLSEVGELSMKASAPEIVSGICAVLAETDVINMVSRGISTANILKGIHQSIVNRLVKLLRSLNPEPPLAVTGGSALDRGLVETLRQKLAADKVDMDVLVHPDSILAGAIGAALWGAFRHERLRRQPVGSPDNYTDNYLAGPSVDRTRDKEGNAMAQLVVRPMKMEDLEKIVLIDSEIMDVRRPDYYQAKMSRMLAGENSLASLVVEDGDQVVGFIMGEVFIGEFGLKERSASIDSVGVAPQHRGFGVASLLLQAFFDNMTKADITKVYSIVDWDDWDLLRFFQKSGFTPSRKLCVERTVG